MTDEEFMKKYGYVWKACHTCGLPILVEKELQLLPSYCAHCNSKRSFRERHDITSVGEIIGITIILAIISWLVIFLLLLLWS